MIPEGDFLVYDGDCPVCQNYVQWTALRQQHPEIVLLDAREHPDLVTALRAEAIEVNDTFVLQINGQRHVGAQAMARISAAMQPEGIVARLLKTTTRSATLLAPIYPVLVRLRKALLWLIGRDQIR